MIDAQSLKQFSFAGHDTFHLRYAWLPKAAEYLQKNKGASLKPFNAVKILAVEEPVSTLDWWASEATNYTYQQGSYHLTNKRYGANKNTEGSEPKLVLLQRRSDEGGC